MIREIFHDPEFAVAIAFVVAMLLVGKRAWVTVIGLIDARTLKIKAELDQAQKLRDEAQRTLAHFQRKQRDALQEAGAIVAHAKEEAGRPAAKGRRGLPGAVRRGGRAFRR